MDGVTDLSVAFTSIAVRSALSSLPLFLSITLITWFGRRWLSARARFAFWTLVLVRMILPVSIQTPFGWGCFEQWWITPMNQPTTKQFFLDSGPFMDVVASPTNVHPLAVEPGPTANAIWFEWLSSASFVGLPAISVLLAIWLVVTSLRLMLRVRREVATVDPVLEAILGEGCRVFGIRSKVQLRVFNDWKAPATLGFFRPLIILPADTESLSESEMRHILWHELAHIKRGDAAFSYLWIAVRCLQWWNPCFWWAQRNWLAEREIACDALAIRSLDSSPAEYGRTLLRFLERLAQSTDVPRNMLAPGLVQFLGEKSEMLRRLRELADPIAIETTWGRWSSLTVMALLAIVGLTDANASKSDTPSVSDAINVPSGTVWQFSSDTGTEVLPHQVAETTRIYDISKAMSAIRRNEPSVPVDYISVCIPYYGIFPWVNGKPPSVKCSIQGDEMTLTANESQHAAIEKVIKHWESFGERQITVELQMISTPKQPMEFLPNSQGRIISPSPLMSNDDSEISPWQTPTGEFATNRSVSTPSFVCMLSPAKRSSLTQLAQGDHRTNLLFCPKVTLFSGQSGMVAKMLDYRPFVTGLRTTQLGTRDQLGTREPEISKVAEGVQFRVSATLVDAAKKIELNVKWRSTELTDVEVLKTKIGNDNQEIAIQIPHVLESSLQTSVTLSSDETYLIAPLRRDQKGRFQVYLITPRLLECDVIP